MSADDTVDLAELTRALWRKRVWVAYGVAAGLLIALAVNLLAPPRYEGTGTILLRTGREGATSSLASSGEDGISLSGLADVLSLGSGFDTELEILTSRTVLEAVVDSLGLQARIRSPALAVREVFSATRFPPGTDDISYRFERVGERYRVTGAGYGEYAVPGKPFKMGSSVVTLRASALPDAFEVEVTSREDAVKRLEKHLDADQARGDVAELDYSARDPVTAAAVPNAIMSTYLARRKTTDRGINQYRYEFLSTQVDSLAAALASAERRLRIYQESSGVLDPEFAGQTELVRAVELRATLETLETQAHGLQQLLARDNLNPRDLAAYPTLLGNPAVSGILSRLLEEEAERTALLQRRTLQDPDVVVRTQRIDQFEQQLVSVASTYLSGLQKQQAQIRGELGNYSSTLAKLPRQAETTYNLQREVKRLSETLTAIQTQLVQTRLAAVAEGGNIRPIDYAASPGSPAFPKPLLNLAIGLFGGLIVGAFGGIGSSYFGRRVADASDAARASGVPAYAIRPDSPLLLSGSTSARGILVLPMGSAALSAKIAHQIALTAGLRGRDVAVAELSDEPGASAHAVDAVGQRAAQNREAAGSAKLVPASDAAAHYLVFQPKGDGASIHLRDSLAELEQRFSLVVAALPPLEHPITVSLLDSERPVVLVAHVGGVTRDALRDTVNQLNGIGVAVVAVVLQENGAA